MLIMFPILITMYVSLAKREEKELMAEFGNEKCLTAGCDVYLAKPLSHVELGDAMEGVLKKRSSQKGMRL